MSLYILEVYCRRNGVSQDAGEQARGDFPDDQTAIAKLTAELNWLRMHYDEVYYGIYNQNHEKIAGRL